MSGFDHEYAKNELDTHTGVSSPACDPLLLLHFMTEVCVYLESAWLPADGHTDSCWVKHFCIWLSLTACFMGSKQQESKPSENSGGEKSRNRPLLNWLEEKPQEGWRVLILPQCLLPFHLVYFVQWEKKGRKTVLLLIALGQHKNISKHECFLFVS